MLSNLSIHLASCESVSSRSSLFLWPQLLSGQVSSSVYLAFDLVIDVNHSNMSTSLTLVLINVKLATKIRAHLPTEHCHWCTLDRSTIGRVFPRQRSRDTRACTVRSWSLRPRWPPAAYCRRLPVAVSNRSHNIGPISSKHNH